MDRRTTVFIVGVMLILFGLLAIYWLAYKADSFVPDDDRSKLNIEIIKLVMNSLIVGGAGLILFGIKSASDQFHEDQMKKTAFLTSVIESYNRVKSVRRRIRFANINKERSEFRFDGTTLDELLLELNEVQLSLEASKKIASANPRYLRPRAARVKECLATMEKFLNKVVDKSVGEFDNVTVNENNGGNLYELIRKRSGSKGSKCEEELFSPMDELIAQLS